MHLSEHPWECNTHFSRRLIVVSLEPLPLCLSILNRSQEHQSTHLQERIKNIISEQYPLAEEFEHTPLPFSPPAGGSTKRYDNVVCQLLLNYTGDSSIVRGILAKAMSWDSKAGSLQLCNQKLFKWPWCSFTIKYYITFTLSHFHRLQGSKIQNQRFELMYDIYYT